jgi:hypothetical protein
MHDMEKTSRPDTGLAACQNAGKIRLTTISCQCTIVKPKLIAKPIFYRFISYAQVLEKRGLCLISHFPIE